MSAFGAAITRNNIATGTTTKRAERERIAATFRQAREEYLKCASRIVELTSMKNESLAGIEQDKGNMQGYEAGWVRDGLIGGKNEAERKAVLAAYKESDEGYRGCAQRVGFEERRIKLELDSELQRYEYEIRAARFDIEWSIAEARMISNESEDHRGK